MPKVHDGVSWNAHWEIHKYHDPTGEIAARLKAGGDVCDYEPYAMDTIENNLGLNEGLQLMADLLIGAGGTVYSNANAYIGVGDSNTAAAATQTALQAAVNKAYVGMDATYPQRSNQTVTWRSTFAAGVGTFAWEEFTVINASTDAGVNLNRKCESKGTKAAADTYTISVAITFS